MKDAVQKIVGENVTPKEFVLELLDMHRTLVELALADKEKTKNFDHISNQSTFLYNIIENVISEM